MFSASVASGAVLVMLIVFCLQNSDGTEGRGVVSSGSHRRDELRVLADQLPASQGRHARRDSGQIRQRTGEEFTATSVQPRNRERKWRCTPNLSWIPTRKLNEK